MSSSPATPIPITVCIPVGPDNSHQRWLGEALESLVTQTMLPNEVLLVSDMADLNAEELATGYPFPVNIYQAPWHLGVAHAFNFGVALAANEYVLMMGADDLLHPDAIRSAVSAIELTKEPARPHTYWWFGVEYMGTGEQQFLPCNAAVVSKSLWKYTGGFPVESAVGAPDTIFISQCLKHHFADLVCIDRNRPLYYYRSHPDSDTNQRKRWFGIIGLTRDLLTETWQPVTWGRRS